MGMMPDINGDAITDIVNCLSDAYHQMVDAVKLFVNIVSAPNKYEINNWRRN